MMVPLAFVSTYSVPLLGTTAESSRVTVSTEYGRDPTDASVAGYALNCRNESKTTACERGTTEMAVGRNATRSIVPRTRIASDAVTHIQILGERKRRGGRGGTPGISRSLPNKRRGGRGETAILRIERPFVAGTPSMLSGSLCGATVASAFSSKGSLAFRAESGGVWGGRIS